MFDISLLHCLLPVVVVGVLIQAIQRHCIISIICPPKRNLELELWIYGLRLPQFIALWCCLCGLGVDGSRLRPDPTLQLSTWGCRTSKHFKWQQQIKASGPKPTKQPACLEIWWFWQHFPLWKLSNDLHEWEQGEEEEEEKSTHFFFFFVQCLSVCAWYN